MIRPSFTPRAREALRCRPRSFRPRIEALEDRCVPTSAGWAMPADPDGYVFHDLNGNSVLDSGESAVGSGWQVYVDANNNAAYDVGETSTTTDAAGHYSLILPDGTYTLRVVPQGSFVNDTLPPGTLMTDFGSVESGYYAGANNYSGLAWANGSLYATFAHVIGTSDNVMYQIDPQNGSVVSGPVSIPGDIAEIAFDGTDFWGADFTNNCIIRFNFSGQELQRLSFAGMHTTGVEWDGSALRVVDRVAARIYRIDPAGTGTILDYINSPGGNVATAAFDGTSLWVDSRESGADRIYALDPTTGAVQKSFVAGPNGEPAFGVGIAVRGTHLWLSFNQLSRVFEYDIGYGGGRMVELAGSDVAGVNLSVFQPAGLTGRVYNQANNAAIAAVQVGIDGNGNGQFDPWEKSVLTDSAGNYSFSGVRPGGYTLVEVLPKPGWLYGTPGDGRVTVSVSSGVVQSGVSFANRVDPTSKWLFIDGGTKDLATGLVWSMDSEVYSATEGSWDWAKNVWVTTMLAQGGFHDWRMPSRAECNTAFSHGIFSVMNGAAQMYGSPTMAYPYWTGDQKGTNYAYTYAFKTGTTDSTFKTSIIFAIGVRRPGTPLSAASLPAHALATTITAADARPLLAQAIRYWTAAGVDTSGLGNIQIQVTNLGGRTLGLASGNTITLDDNAAGWGWYTFGAPPFFVKGRGRADRMDLLTVLEHEVGHLLGKEHTATGVMMDTLSPGVRRT